MGVKPKKLRSAKPESYLSAGKSYRLLYAGATPLSSAQAPPSPPPLNKILVAHLLTGVYEAGIEMVDLNNCLVSLFKDQLFLSF